MYEKGKQIHKTSRGSVKIIAANIWVEVFSDYWDGNEWNFDPLCTVVKIQIPLDLQHNQTDH